MNNFLIGFLTGIAGLFPGISGSAILVFFNKYNEIIENIYNVLKSPLKSIKYLFPFGLGIFLGMFLLSNILKPLLDNHALFMSILFIFLILGTIPKTINNITKSDLNKKSFIYFLITFILGITLLFFKNVSFGYVYNISTIYVLLMGIILSFSTIIPGVSTTVLFNIFGFYNIYLDAIKSLNFSILIPLIFSFIIITFMLSKLLTSFFKKNYSNTYLAILGFTISTIPSLLFTKIVFNFEFFLAIIIGSIISFLINKIIKRNA